MDGCAILASCSTRPRLRAGLFFVHRAPAGERSERVARRHAFGFPRLGLCRPACGPRSGRRPDQFPKTYAVASVCVERRSLLVGGISVRPKAHGHMGSRRVDKLTSCQIVRGKVGQNRLDKLTSCQEVRSFCLEHNILCCSMYACTKRTFCMTVLSRAARYCSYCSYIVPSGSVRKSLIIQ